MIIDKQCHLICIMAVIYCIWSAEYCREVIEMLNIPKPLTFTLVPLGMPKCSAGVGVTDCGNDKFLGCESSSLLCRLSINDIERFTLRLNPDSGESLSLWSGWVSLLPFQLNFLNIAILTDQKSPKCRHVRISWSFNEVFDGLMALSSLTWEEKLHFRKLKGERNWLIGPSGNSILFEWNCAYRLDATPNWD